MYVRVGIPHQRTYGWFVSRSDMGGVRCCLLFLLVCPWEEVGCPSCTSLLQNQRIYVLKEGNKTMFYFLPVFPQRAAV